MSVKCYGLLKRKRPSPKTFKASKGTVAELRTKGCLELGGFTVRYSIAQKSAHLANPSFFQRCIEVNWAASNGNAV